MTNNHMTITNKQARRQQIMKVMTMALVFTMLFSIFTMTDASALLANGPGGGGANNTALNQVLSVVTGIIKSASMFIGIIIAVWGVFQIVLAFRREDSEGISKQITTIVVGTVLVGFGAILDNIVQVLQSSAN